MISISKPLLGAEEEKLVLEVLRSGNLVQGEKVEEFEKEFAKYVGVRHAIATNSGTSALHTVLLACGIKENHEVITTPFTFIASVNSIAYCGAKPIFVDISKEDFNIDKSLIEKAITKKTKALMPVHLYGNPCDMDAIKKIAEKHDLSIIEDACQAHGAEFKSKKVGSFGIGCFSFYPSKNMTTGEGGMITTDSDEISERCRLIRNHGQKVRYYHDIIGYNYRMTNLAAAIGIPQLKKLEGFNNKRIKNAEYLTKRLSKLKWLITPKANPNSRHVFHQYTLRITGKDRDETAKILTSKGIGNSVYYPVPVTLQKPYKHLNASMPASEKIAKEVLSIPVHPALSNEDLNFIAKTFEEM